MTIQLPCYVCGTLIDKDELDENAAYTYPDNQPYCPDHDPDTDVDPSVHDILQMPLDEIRKLPVLESSQADDLILQIDHSVNDKTRVWVSRVEDVVTVEEYDAQTGRWNEVMTADYSTIL